MEYVNRLLDLSAKTRARSCFLFGPRQTGKSTLVRHTMPDSRVYNLLDSDVFHALSRRPSLIRDENPARGSLVVIDEIQKLPQLLDEVHLLIEEHGVRFLLTGSSARKLRRGGVNLLGGRARQLTLHPFVYREVPGLDLLRALDRGTIPSVHFSDDPETDLAAYVGTYLREEIAAEGATRSLPAFSRFLDVAALCNGTLVNYTNVANDAQVARTTVQEYFQILFDTSLAHPVPAWGKTKKRKPIGTDKFYFFDVGVVRHLRNEGRLKARSPAVGTAFETYIFHELKSWIDYSCRGSICHWRSTSNMEVDFILNDETAIEVKAKENIDARDLAGLRALKEETLLKNYVVASLVPRPLLVDGIRVMPWRNFLEALWSGKFA
ncbi:MAG: ATP-binding protein [Deltaproteobacteria bacterium]|nr:ATP-binding protein [Deltaproteobacteria bacterium]